MPKIVGLILSVHPVAITVAALISMVFAYSGVGAYFNFMAAVVFFDGIAIWLWALRTASKIVAPDKNTSALDTIVIGILTIGIPIFFWWTSASAPAEANAVIHQTVTPLLAGCWFAFVWRTADSFVRWERKRAITPAFSRFTAFVLLLLLPIGIWLLKPRIELLKRREVTCEKVTF